MKGVDEVRGYEREILFNQENLYTTGGGIALTNCVVEAKEDDWQGKAPMLSMRFYHKPYLNRMLKNPRNHVAVDDRRLTPIENKQLIRVHLRLSAAYKPFSAAC